MDRQNRRIFTWTLVMPLLLVAIAFAAMLFYRSISIRRQLNSAYEQLEYSSSEKMVQLLTEIESQQRVLGVCADSMEFDANSERNNIIGKLNTCISHTDFYLMGYLNSEGKGWLSDGRYLNGAQESFFSDTMAGQAVVQAKTYSTSNRHTSALIFTAPVISNGKTIGIIYGEMLQDKLRSLLSNEGKTNFSFTTDAQGNIIVGSEHNSHLLSYGNVLTTLSGKLDQSSSIPKLQHAINVGISGHIGYNLSGQAYYAVYKPFGINGWMLFCGLDTSAVKADAIKMTQSGTMILVGVMIASILVLAGVYIINSRSREQLEYEQEQLRLSDARFRIALENSNLSIWDYDFATHSIIQAEHSLSLHGEDRVILNVPRSLLTGGIVHPDSAQAFADMFVRLHRGEAKAEGVFRIRNGDKGYWYQHIRYKTIYDKHGHPYRAIGMAEDVTERFETAKQYQNKLNQLNDLAQRDMLTGILNRGAVEAEIISRLENAKPESVQAMYIVDLDGFKKVNDQLGHDCGDQTLAEVAKAIRGVFRSTDIVGRLGGDEFVVFLSSFRNPELVESRARELCNALQFVYTGREGLIYVTASIGVTVCYGTGHTFMELYRQADKSLYRAKEGRNRYILENYSESDSEEEPIHVDRSAAIQLKALFDYIDAGVLMLEMGKEPKILYANSTFYTAIRHDPPFGDMSLNKLFSTVHQEDRQNLFDMLRSAAETGNSVNYEYRALMQDGKYTWRHFHADRIPYQDSGNPLLLATITDISELAAGREELRKNRERLRFAYEQSNVTVWEIDLSTREISFWPEEITETGRQARMCQRIRSILMNRDQTETTREFFSKLYQHNKENGGVFEDVQNGDRVRFRLAYRMIYDRCGKAVGAVGVAGLIQDIKDIIHAD